ncbi:uncharacterized protein LOC129604914 [Betta splendens]|uniref:Uncharacterized protein LOC129604914 n=1 Tax=Betta splendens TaxID=158456 RepID=A0A9W2Y5M1_BETSP|nr:uncharacterized protein LOC129604914 [Betta splendens]
MTGEDQQRGSQPAAWEHVGGIRFSAAHYKTSSSDGYQNMDSAPNGCSKEQLPVVCDRTTALRHQAALFLKLYDKKEARLRDLHAEIQEIGIQVQKWDTKSKWSFYTGLISAAVAVAAGLTVSFTGAVGFAITAALTSVAAGGAVFGFKIKQFRTEEESLRRIKQFLKIVNRLENDLDELLKLYEKAELPHDLLKLFQSMDAFRAADGVSELTAQCHVVFQELVGVRERLREAEEGSEEPLNSTQTSTPVSADGKEGREKEVDNSSEASSLLGRTSTSSRLDSETEAGNRASDK